MSRDKVSDQPAQPESRRRQVALALAAFGISLTFRALVVVVSLKYLMLVMRADNRGEGEILALLVLLFAFQSRGTARAPSLVRDPVSRRRGANDGQAAERRGAG